MAIDGTGTVYLVGAGPGDPELLTVKAHRLIGEADVLLHDSLVRDSVVEAVPPPSTEVIHVGKRPGDDGRRWTQSEINRLMVRRASMGETVVRLKGGDPTVFGRGGEEAEHLARAGVPFEIVPGVSSMTAAPAVTGIPVTHRDHASTLTVVTGHEDPSKAESSLDWATLASTVAAGGTLVILMGVGRLERNVAALTANGLSGDTPVAMIERATWPEGTMVRGTIDTIVEDRDRAGIEPPAVTVVGQVVDVYDGIADELRSALRGTAAADRRRDRPETAAGGATLASTSSLD